MLKIETLQLFSETGQKNQFFFHFLFSFFSFFFFYHVQSDGTESQFKHCFIFFFLFCIVLFVCWFQFVCLFVFHFLLLLMLYLLLSFTERRQVPTFNHGIECSHNESGVGTPEIVKSRQTLLDSLAVLR